ncbi:MAG: class I SAM-dependent methyltransferase [Acidobacteriota bacterium]
MNNPLRAAVQRRFEGPRLLQMGGALAGGTALEIGCGCGAGVGIILDLFEARSVDGFDLDPRMVCLARARLKSKGSQVRLWVGEATAIAARDASYDAVFDFGMIHHVPAWRAVLAESFRVLKPGGRFYAEEALAGLICHPAVRGLLDHPQADRFDTAAFCRGLLDVGFEAPVTQELWRSFGWFVTTKPGSP